MDVEWRNPMVAHLGDPLREDEVVIRSAKNVACQRVREHSGSLTSTLAAQSRGAPEPGSVVLGSTGCRALEPGSCLSSFRAGTWFRLSRVNRLPRTGTRFVSFVR